MGKYNLAKKQEREELPPGREGSPQKSFGLSRLYAESRPQWRQLLLGSLALFGATLASLAQPALFGQLMDAMSSDGGAETSAEARREKLLQAVGGLIAVTVADGGLNFMRSYCFALAGERVVAALRRRVFVKLIEAEVAFHDSARVGELISRVGGDTIVLKDAATSNLPAAVKNICIIAGGLAYLAWLSLQLTGIMLLLVPALAIGSRYYGRYTKKLSKSVRDKLAEATAVAEESFSNIRTVRSLSCEGKQEAAFSAKVEETLNLGVRAAAASAGFAGAVEAITGMAFAGLMYSGGLMVLSGDLSAGTLTAFLLYSVRIGAAMSSLANLFASAMSALGAQARVFAILDRVPWVPLRDGRILQGVRGEVTFERVTFAYSARPEVDVLQDVSVHIPSGSVVAFVGPSGSGKSTLLALVEGLAYATAGRVLIDGKDITQLNGYELRKRLGLVLQEPVLFAVSIAENIRFGRPDATDEEVRAAAAAANCLGFIESFPAGFDTLVGERGVRVSGGQRQRIAIARALLQNPRILLLDESTSSLDSESEAAVMEALERLMAHRTVLIVAHRLNTVRQASKVFVLNAGKLVGSGSHDELLSSNALYSKLVRKQLITATGPGAGAGAGAGAGLAAASLAADLAELDAESSAAEASMLTPLAGMRDINGGGGAGDEESGGGSGETPATPYIESAAAAAEAEEADESEEDGQGERVGLLQKAARRGSVARVSVSIRD